MFLCMLFANLTDTVPLILFPGFLQLLDITSRPPRMDNLHPESDQFSGKYNTTVSQLLLFFIFVYISCHTIPDTPSDLCIYEIMPVC